MKLERIQYLKRFAFDTGILIAISNKTAHQDFLFDVDFCWRIVKKSQNVFAVGYLFFKDVCSEIVKTLIISHILLILETAKMRRMNNSSMTA